MMGGATWIGLWLLFLIAAMGLPPLLAALWGHRTRWLSRFGWLGALGLALMVPALSQSASISRIILPPPWPALTAAPLPLASLWAAVAALLFAGAVWSISDHPKQKGILYALLPLEACVAFYLWSGSGLLLLVTWEMLSAVTYLGLVSTRRARPVWNAGWALLVLSELGGILLLIALVWLIPGGHVLSDSFAGLAQSALHSHATTLIMILALIAFGVKAGLFPVMVWMPLAEPQAPGVVAGLFSGLLTALAVDGILALQGVMHPGLDWGILLFALGVLGALSAALYSVLARQVKQVLAYSTLEVLGIVFAAIGMWSIATRLAPDQINGTLALDGALVLLVAHAGAKFVLFAVTDVTGFFGQNLDRLGGLVHRLHGISGWSLFAVATLAGIPPLGGFVGEWLVLQAILRPMGASGPRPGGHLSFVFGGALLALAVAIGIASYLRWYAFIFLGPSRQSTPRQDLPPRATSGRWDLLLPSLLVLLTGPAIPWFLVWLNRQLAPLLGTPTDVLAPTRTDPSQVSTLVQIGGNLLPAPGTPGSIFFPQGFSVGDPYVLTAMILFLGAIVALIRAAKRGAHAPRRVAPWTGGLEPFSSQTSFSAEGFVHPIRLAFAAFYGLQRERRDQSEWRLYRHSVVQRLERHFYLPLLNAAERAARQARHLQSGRSTQYTSYVLAGILLSLLLGILH